MKNKSLIIFGIILLVCLVFVIYKFTRPMEMGVNFDNPTKQETALAILKGYDVKSAVSNPEFGPVIVATVIYTNTSQALLLVYKLKGEQLYKEDKLHFDYFVYDGGNRPSTIFDDYFRSLIINYLFTVTRH